MTVSNETVWCLAADSPGGRAIQDQDEALGASAPLGMLACRQIRHRRKDGAGPGANQPAQPGEVDHQRGSPAEPPPGIPVPPRLVQDLGVRQRVPEVEVQVIALDLEEEPGDRATHLSEPQVVLDEELVRSGPVAGEVRVEAGIASQRTVREMVDWSRRRHLLGTVMSLPPKSFSVVPAR
jgi:hypothetical protein